MLSVFGTGMQAVVLLFVWPSQQSIMVKLLQRLKPKRAIKSVIWGVKGLWGVAYVTNPPPKALLPPK